MAEKTEVSTLGKVAFVSIVLCPMGLVTWGFAIYIFRWFTGY